MKKIIALVLLLAAATCLFAAKEKEVPKVEVTMPFSKGVNLSYWLEPEWFGNDGTTYYNKQDFEDIKSIGVDIVRIPIHFESWSSGAPDYIIEDWVWEILDKAVDWCTELNLYVIIDFHNDCLGKFSTSPDIEKVLKKIWPQIAGHFKNSGEYVLYELFNEPHMRSGNVAADVAKWNKIQGNILKLIRTIDTTHTVIVGAENWNGVVELLKLPDYKDDNIIYNYHDYLPFLFTYQGLPGFDQERIKNVPFPYDKNRMPPLPQNPTDTEKWFYENYSQAANEANLVKPLDDAVKFANKRKVALMCNEYGCNMTYADPAERLNWYRLKAKWMDERNIIRVSWNYRDANGLFNYNIKDLTWFEQNMAYKVRFPEDLNKDLLEAMGYTVPSVPPRQYHTWLDSAKKKGDYTIYNNGFAENTHVYGLTNKEQDMKFSPCRINKKDSPDEPSYIYMENMKAKSYDYWGVDFGGTCDFSSLVSSGKSLEFEVRTNQKNLKFDCRFKQFADYSEGKTGFPWRASSNVKVSGNGEWQKISIPLKDFYDVGAWNEAEQKWYDGEGLFNWKKVQDLEFAIIEDLTDGVSIRNIVIR